MYVYTHTHSDTHRHSVRAEPAEGCGDPVCEEEDAVHLGLFVHGHRRVRVALLKLRHGQAPLSQSRPVGAQLAVSLLHWSSKRARNRLRHGTGP